MKEAFGGVFSLEFIIFFLLLLMGFLAFSVNYTKAFRVKNEIRSIIQKSEGLTKEATEDIETYMDSVHYTQSEGFNTWCQKNGLQVCRTGKGSFCYSVKTSDKYGTRPNATTGNPENIAAYYTVYTFVDINVPVLNKLLPFTAGIFTVTGETSLIYTGETPTIMGDATKLDFCGGGA